MPSKLTSVLFAAAVFTSCTKSIDLNPALESGPVTSQTPAPNTNRPAFVPNEVLVKFKDGSSARGRESVFSLVGGIIKEQVLTPAMESKGEDLGFFVVSTPMSVEKAVSILQADDRVEYAEPNYLFYPNATANDPLLSTQWGVGGGFGAGAIAAWNNNNIGSTTVYVGVLDEGIMYSHEDLIGNAINPFEIAGNRKDDDGNGVVDDTYGYDFANNDLQVFDGLGDDHGTHVAGIIGAVGNNSKGVAGMCWQVKMISGKFIGSTGGTAANAVRAMDYMSTLATKKTPIVAVNCSWSTPVGVVQSNSTISSLQGAVNRLQSAGVLLITSVGNDSVNMDGSRGYPAAFSNANIIRVTSVDQTGAKPLLNRSNWGGSWVDIGAPGVNIQSTIPISIKGKISSGYGYYSGTSQAAAYVTGAIAMYKAKNPLATASTIKSDILLNATKTSSLVGFTGYNGSTLNVSGF